MVQTDWFRSLARYEKPDLRRAIWQLVNTIVPYCLLWGALIILLQRGAAFWKLLPLVFLAAGFLVRLFIVFHDCTHSAFFVSRRANRILGYLMGILTFTPFDAWRRSHTLHHATAGDLDRRGAGDIWTMTVDEYRAAPGWTRIGYWLYRKPWFLPLVGAPFMFLVLNRFAHRSFGPRERKSVWITNLALLALLTLASVTIGARIYLLIQLPIIALAASCGGWLFYVQHQFDDVYWERHADWDPMRAALEGSSYYKLPRVLQWFTGSIGLHHVHHLRPRIPNYNLQCCYDAIPALQEVTPLTLRQSLTPSPLDLWDEAQGCLVSFRSLRKRRP